MFDDSITLTKKEWQILSAWLHEQRDGWSNPDIGELLRKFKWVDNNSKFDYDNDEFLTCKEKFEKMNIEGPWVF